ncbi:hypothetical protein [Lactococcus lactis]|uniref:hypothetical protein n=1 Tax=Lactococcus lactis TaxID=1358 RepID=UPI003C6D2C13
MKIKNLLMAVTTVATLGAIGTVSAQASAASSNPVYRLYNPNTGEHFYTENFYEQKSLSTNGWRYEGVGWQAATSGTPVYRVYNPNARGGDHYYTMSKYEAQSLVNKGWRWDNNGKAAFYSGGSVNLYVAYNPNANSGSHNYTTNTYEQNSLLGKGWRYGKVAWKTMGSTPAPKPTPPAPSLPGGMSPNAPHKETVNQLPATPSNGLTAAQIKANSGVSSYEGVPNFSYKSVGVTIYLFGAASPQIDPNQSLIDSLSDEVAMFGGNLTYAQVVAAYHFQGLTAPTKAQYDDNFK